MPEGDTIFRAARTLHRALAGSPVTRFESEFPALNRIDDDRPIAGRLIESVSARGKHLLMTFSGDLLLRTHMKMHGSWHIYRPGERWRRPAREMRIVIETARFVAVGFNVPVAEFLTGRALSRHRELGALGPDLLAPPGPSGDAGPAFDRAEVLRRIRAQGHTAIAEVLLNQRVVAGIGNVFKSEILFVAGIDPFTAASTLSDAALTQLIDEAQRLLGANVLDRSQALSTATGRRTTRSLDPTATLWVYGRGGKPCRKCGGRILAKKTGLDARSTYWCARCQEIRN
ncbi:MAG: DNA-formamidopyrimidine glycosylase family protein [Acidobacteriota bacterium]